MNNPPSGWEEVARIAAEIRDLIEQSNVAKTVFALT
jgi:hypothetical protein